MKLRSLLTAVTAIILAVGTVTAVQAVSSQLTADNNLMLYGRAFNPDGYFTVDDSMVITGNASVEGSTEVKGELFNSKKAVTINDDLRVTGKFILNSIHTPSSSSCNKSGTISYDASNLYICVASNWKKVPLQSL